MHTVLKVELLPTSSVCIVYDQTVFWQLHASAVFYSDSDTFYNAPYHFVSIYLNIITHLFSPFKLFLYIIQAISNMDQVICKQQLPLDNVASSVIRNERLNTIVGLR